MPTPSAPIKVPMWSFPLIEVGQDKRLSRVGVQTGAAAELVGFDGTLDGGLRPLSGFREVRELDFYSDTHHNETSRITQNGFFPVDFRIGPTAYGYGFVYRVSRRIPVGGESSSSSSSSSSGGQGVCTGLVAGDVFIDYYSSETKVWRTGVRIMCNASKTAQMDVQVVGRFVFVFIEGRSPALFYLRGTGAPFTETVIGETVDGPFPGPGKRPGLLSPDQAGDLGSLKPTDIDNTLRSGTGQIILVDITPGNEPLLDVDPISSSSSSSSGAPPVSSSFSSSSSSSCSAILNPDVTYPVNATEAFTVSVRPRYRWDRVVGAIRYRVILIGPAVMVDTPNGPQPSFASSPVRTLGFTNKLYFDQISPALRHGSFYKILVLSHDCNDNLGGFNPRQTSLFSTKVAPGAPAHKLDAGDYVFSYFLYDSQTGRRSPLSTIAQARRPDFFIDPQDQSEGSDAVPDITSDPTPRFAVLELVYDSTKYDQAWIYRSVRVQGAGGTFTAGIQQLDEIVTLADSHTTLNGVGQTFDPGNTGLRHVLYYYQLEDKQLVYQDVYFDSSTFDEVMPRAGAALFYETSLMLSKITNPPASTTDEERAPDATRGLGELRWSSLVENSPEMFPPKNRLTPRVPSNEIIRMVQAGTNAIGFSLDRMYHIRRESVFIKIQEMHEGYGIANVMAADTVGQWVHIVTPRGVKAVDGNGQLDEIRGLDFLIRDEWQGQLNNVSVAFDPLAGVLFIHNPDLQETALMWFDTAKITQIQDLPFLEGRQGAWPRDPTNFDDTLVKRALFVQNVTTNDAAEVITDWKPKVYLLDHDRSKVVAGHTSVGINGNPRLMLLDSDGDALFAATPLNISILDTLNPTIQIDTPVTFDPTVVATNGFKLYVTECSDESLIGQSMTIRLLQAPRTFLMTAASHALMVNLRTTTGKIRLSLSPVVCRWVGHPVAVQDREGFKFSGLDFFTVKTFDTVAAAFTDVSGEAFDVKSGSDDRYRGLAYRGVNVAAAARAFPVDRDGSEQVKSIEDGNPTRRAAFRLEPPTAAPAQGRQDTLGRYGVRGNSLTPGIEIICTDLDFRLLQVVVSGRIEADTRGGPGIPT